MVPGRRSLPGLLRNEIRFRRKDRNRVVAAHLMSDLQQNADDVRMIDTGQYPPRQQQPRKKPQREARRLHRSRGRLRRELERMGGRVARTGV